MGLNGFYLVLPSFTGFHKVLPNFTGFYLVSMGFTGFSWVLSGFYLVSLGSTGFYWVLPGVTKFYRVFFFFQFPLHRQASTRLSKTTKLGNCT